MKGSMEPALSCGAQTCVMQLANDSPHGNSKLAIVLMRPRVRTSHTVAVVIYKTHQPDLGDVKKLSSLAVKTGIHLSNYVKSRDF